MLRQQRQQRATWLELDEPARRGLQVRRPGEDTVASWRSMIESVQGGNVLSALPKLREIARDVVIDWRGFTEADLLGEAVGASSPQEFDKDIFAEWVDDESVILIAIATHAATVYAAHRDKKAAAEKNS